MTGLDTGKEEQDFLFCFFSSKCILRPFSLIQIGVLSIMAKLGTEKNPAIVHVQDLDRANEVAEIFEHYGWKFIIGLEPEKPENVSDLVKLLNRPQPVSSLKTGRNEPCPCGSGIKHKNCCG